MSKAWQTAVISAALATSSTLLFAQQLNPEQSTRPTAPTAGLQNSAGPADPTSQQLLEELRALRARVEQLEQRPPTEAEVEATKRKVEADVASKQANVFLRYDKNGMLLSNEDGTFTFRPQLLFTLRYVYNTRDGNGSNTGTGDPGEDDQDSSGFEVRRWKFTASGTALTKQLTYGLDLTSSANGGGLSLNDAFVTYRLGETSDFYVRGGQFKSPFAHEELTPDSNSVAAESSLISQTLGGRATGRVQGVALLYGNQNKDNPFNGWLMFADGDKSLNTDFRQTNSNKFSAYARGEYKAFGDWKSYNNLSHLDSKDDLLVFGGGVATSQGEDTVYRATLDAQYEFAQRWALFGAVFAAQNNRDTGNDTFDTGGLLQLAYVIAPKWEVFGRYNITKFEDDVANGTNRAQELTAGLNYLLGEEGEFWRQARLTLDVGYLPDGSPANFLSENYLQSDGPQIVTRVQFRLIL